MVVKTKKETGLGKRTKQGGHSQLLMTNGNKLQTNIICKQKTNTKDT